MIDAYPATIIMLAFIVFFGVILPIMDKSKKFGKFVSLRFAVLVVFLSMAVGVVLDFSHLENNIRFAVIVGTLIIGGIFFIIRTWEKAAANGWSIGIKKIEAGKGDAKVTVDLDDGKK